MRAKRRRERVLEANIILRNLISLDSGLCKTRTLSRGKRAVELKNEELPATQSLYTRVLRLAADAVQVRRESSELLTGAQVAAKLVKADLLDRYSFRMKQHNQVPLIAAALDEPPRGRPTVPMLEALPRQERESSIRKNKMSWTCRARVLEFSMSCRNDMAS